MTSCIFIYVGLYQFPVVIGNYNRFSEEKTMFACRISSLTKNLINRRNSSAFLSEYRGRKVYKFPVLYPPDFFWCKFHPGAHPLPCKICHLHFSPSPTRTFLAAKSRWITSRKDKTCYSFSTLR